MFHIRRFASAKFNNIEIVSSKEKKKSRLAIIESRGSYVLLHSAI